MIDIDSFFEMLNEVCEELPDDFFRELHYGVHLSEECKFSPYADDGSMIIMGDSWQEPNAWNPTEVCLPRLFLALFLLRPALPLS